MNMEDVESSFVSHQQHAYVVACRVRACVEFDRMWTILGDVRVSRFRFEFCNLLLRKSYIYTTEGTYPSPGGSYPEYHVSTRVRPVKFWPSPIDGRMNRCQTVPQFPHHSTVVFSWTAEAVFCAAAGPGACTSHRGVLQGRSAGVRQGPHPSPHPKNGHSRALCFFFCLFRISCRDHEQVCRVGDHHRPSLLA
jgi:hypothetical protein